MDTGLPLRDLIASATPDWFDDAACRGMSADMFFPDPTDVPGRWKALAVCGDCPVAAECLDHAVANHLEFGIWGGAGERERRRIAKSRRASLRQVK